MWNCPRCGQPTKGSFSKGGTHFAICEECMSQDVEEHQERRFIYERSKSLERSKQMIGVGDIVWVNELSAEGKSLPHEWYGKVISIKNDQAMITDSAYPGETWAFWLGFLELKEQKSK